MRLHPDNTSTHYVMTLPQCISMSGLWECGLIDGWYNVRNVDSWFFLKDRSICVFLPQWYDRSHMTPNTVLTTLSSSSMSTRYAQVVSPPHQVDDSVFSFVHKVEFVVTQEFESLYVYTDVMESRVVGDNFVPLLRIAAIQGDHGQTMSNISTTSSTSLVVHGVWNDRDRYKRQLRRRHVRS